MWILLSNKQQWSMWRHLLPALALKVTVFSQQLWTQSENCLGWMKTNHYSWGEPVTWPLVYMLPNPFSVTRCCHLWASWGIALSLAPQLSLWWPGMLSSLMAGRALFSTQRGDGVLDQHQPKQNKCSHHFQSVASHTQILLKKTHTKKNTQDEPVCNNVDQ